jgi:prolipoprotein diacylglyceryl transferase
MDLLGIVWDADPAIIKNPLEIRYYGVCWALGFMLGYQALKGVFKRDGIHIDRLDTLLMYSLLGGILGARLGHVIFYGPWYTDEGTGYFDDPISILKINEGGLASHGGVIGMLIAMWLFSRYVSKKNMFWVLDKVVIGVAISAAMIRIGNFFNHEIAGTITDLPWGVHFTNFVHPITHQMDASGVFRHPVVLYEAFAYLAIFALLLYAYQKWDWRLYKGRMFGWFLALVFGVRMLTEIVKVHQVDLDDSSILTRGQWLSLPLLLAGVFFIWYSNKQEKRSIDDLKLEAKEKKK